MRRYFTKSVTLDEQAAVATIKEKSIVWEGRNSLDLLIEKIGDARIVMLGEASHGTHEYYTLRNLISRRLIDEKAFNFVAVEGDWPDCYRINLYAKGNENKNKSARDVLFDFNRWPTWMWANWEMVAFTEWLHKHNLNKGQNTKAGFYGLDVYSLWESMEAIMDYLKIADPVAYQIAEEAYRCFASYKRGNGSSYAAASRFVSNLCEDAVINLLKEIRYKLPQYNSNPEKVFGTEQNALIAVNAERYYRAMIKGGPHSWNIRDKHMEETLERLLDFYGPESKAIIWAHNTHIGDARATDMISEGMYNIGELARMKYKKEDVFLLGFGSYKGSVAAGESWGSDMKYIDMPPAAEGSWEYLLHNAGGEDRLVFMDGLEDDQFMENHIRHRAIGVVYNPRYEHYGNYVPSILPLRYDAFIYLDETRALYPLHIQPDGSEVPETYPFGV